VGVEKKVKGEVKEIFYGNLKLFFDYTFKDFSKLELSLGRFQEVFDITFS
jgi:hypothetical protein